MIYYYALVIDVDGLITIEEFVDINVAMKYLVDSDVTDIISEISGLRNGKTFRKRGFIIKGEKVPVRWKTVLVECQ
jgi:hypothetical protein